MVRGVLPQAWEQLSQLHEELLSRDPGISINTVLLVLSSWQHQLMADCHHSIQDLAKQLEGTSSQQPAPPAATSYAAGPPLAMTLMRQLTLTLASLTAR